MSSHPADASDRAGLVVVYETHSTTIDNERGIATGWLPGELSAAGVEQAGELGRRRRSDGIDLVLTSDLSRAVRTAHIAFGGSGIQVVQDRRLRECDYGSLTGGPVTGIRPRIAFLDERFPAGESYRDVCRRTAGVLAELALRSDLTRVLIVAHSAQRWVLRELLGGEDLADVLTGPDPWQPGWEYVLPAGWTREPE
jgi:broad specificity phosphatase PhoE